MTYPIYCVNLDRRPDRWARIDAQAQGLGIPIMRVSAIDAKNPEAPAIVSVLPQTGPFGRLTLPVLSCTMSQIGVWRMIAEGESDWGVVLEDDVLISPSFDDVVRALISHAGLPGLIKLETPGNRRGQLFSKSVENVGDFQLHKLFDFSVGAAGYLMRKDVAARALAKIDRINVPVDHFLFEPAGRPGEFGEPFLLLDPGVVWQERSIPSDIASERRSDKNLERTLRDQRLRLRAQLFRFVPVVMGRANRHQFKYGA
jgi:glycosyl transferase family 25